MFNIDITTYATIDATTAPYIFNQLIFTSELVIKTFITHPIKRLITGYI